MEAPESTPRRRFLANVFLGIAGALSFGAFGQRFLAFLTPPAPPEREVEIAAARLDAIPDGGGTVVHRPSGHVALERVGGEVRAFSAVCTHLGCIIQWQPTTHHVWYCACHKGKYDRHGQVVGGPPPRPLPPIPVALRDGQVFVRLKVRPAEDLT